MRPIRPFDSTAYLELPFRNSSFPELGIEITSLGDLRQKLLRSHYERIQRVHFHVLTFYEEGQGIQEVDFVRISCLPGVLTHVRPGQLHRWISIQEVGARVLFFTPDFLPPKGNWSQLGKNEHRINDAFGPTHLTVEGESLEAIRSSFEAIAREYDRTTGDAFSKTILHHLLSALLAQLAQEELKHAKSSPLPLAQEETFRQFRQELERSFMRSRNVADYAQSIGCSTKTLTRASIAVAGVPPKDYIDARVTLEAKRLLAHTSLPVGEIGNLLGFSETTNFVKFFRRHAKVSPIPFRDAIKNDLG